MARPRVFISSTFYDLRQVRADLEQLVHSLGYEAVLHERGAIPYGSQEKLEEYAYREIESCDILISVIGGRFGTPSEEDPYSISQKELRRAVELGKQVYVFVDRMVSAEYETYLLNKDLEGVTYKSVDDVKIFAFIEEVHQLPRNNPIHEFSNARDISDFLREQWAGLFQRFLAQQSLLKEARLLDNMQSTVRTLDELVTFLTEERRDHDEAIKEILLRNHPLFEQLRTALNTPYRIFFTNLTELDEWLSGGRDYEAVKPGAWDQDDYREWVRDIDDKSFRLLKVWTGVFDDDERIKSFTSDEWHPEWVHIETRLKEEPDSGWYDDEDVEEQEEDEEEAPSVDWPPPPEV